MVVKKQGKDPKMTGKEPVFIVKPALKNFGLDYLHITLLALVVVLIVLAFALSYFKQGVVITNCQYGSMSNGTCNTTMHTSAQALAAASRYLAAYSSINTSLSLIPYFSLVNESEVSYLPQSKEWLVVTPYIDPYNRNITFNISMALHDSNLSIANSYLQTLKPAIPTNDSVAALGTVSLYGESACKTSLPIPIYVVTDPYAPGMLNALNTTISAARNYGNTINVSYFFIFGGYSIQYYKSFGIEQTQQLGRYLVCASKQRGTFAPFVSNLSMAYTGKPIPNQTLYQIVQGSGLNATEFGSCMQNVTTTLNIQAQFASLYHIVSTPEIIANCRYSTIPQTLDYAINYSVKHLNG
ncbi:MAG: hypothetical protein KGI06_02675 [Candidatus Micrarchaeota archaeon]|nr:hypothetical protein [Candidatus Micrarchaeota archaeon]